MRKKLTVTRTKEITMRNKNKNSTSTSTVSTEEGSKIMLLVIASTEVVIWHQSLVRKRMNYLSINSMVKSFGSVSLTEMKKVHGPGQMAQTLSSPNGTWASRTTGEAVKTALLSRVIVVGTISTVETAVSMLASMQQLKTHLPVKPCPIGSNLLPCLTSTLFI